MLRNARWTNGLWAASSQHRVTRHAIQSVPDFRDPAIGPAGRLHVPNGVQHGHERRRFDSRPLEESHRFGVRILLPRQSIVAIPTWGFEVVLADDMSHLMCQYRGQLRIIAKLAKQPDGQVDAAAR
jgi:hypothetical protein